ncbi:MAG: hypothetical protein QT11_C0001G0507 [archaeon GW2011_AR20]|nr:MAG: hypothetical protein QT11_C0001G0507 [archaeon GW2011_AR20]AQS28179.1 hypothetical protein [uncultured archaeon]MBS3160525.1 flippase-like domain-containing protein [Candidatus Woesearchaeota archaeon]
MKLSRIIAFVIGIIILLLIIKTIGTENLIEIAKEFKIIYLPIIILILLLDYFLAGLNTWLIASSFRKTSLKKIIKATYIILVYAAITPGKIADLLMIPLLKKEKLTLSQSTITVGLDKIISLLIRVFFGLIGAIFILKKFDFLFLGIPLIALFIIILTIMLLKSKKFLSFVKNKLLRKYAFLFKGFNKDLKNSIKGSKKYIIYNSLVTIFKTFLEALLFFFLFLSFGQETNIIIIFFMFSLLSIIMLLTSPIGISGIGVREGISIIVFGLVGVNSAVVFNSFMVRLILIYLINFITITIYKEELNLLKGAKIFKKFKL